MHRRTGGLVLDMTRDNRHRTFTLLRPATEASLLKNEKAQYSPDQKCTRSLRSRKKFLGSAQVEEIRRNEIILDLKNLLSMLPVEVRNTKINLLALGCRNHLEIDFLSGIDKNFIVKGIDLAPVSDKSENIIQGNVENFLDTKGNKIAPFVNEGVDIYYSSHNLEHLSDPIQHFEKLLEHAKDDTLCYYILPCWNGSVGPTLGHPNYIHCTHTYESFNNKSFSDYLSEVLPHNVGAEIIFTKYREDICDDLRVAFRVTKQ